MSEELPEIHEKLFEAQIILEIALAGSLMTMFCSTLPPSESTHVLSMFILEGEPFLLQIISGRKPYNASANNQYLL